MSVRCTSVHTTTYNVGGPAYAFPYEQQHCTDQLHEMCTTDMVVCTVHYMYAALMPYLTTWQVGTARGGIGAKMRDGVA